MTTHREASSGIHTLPAAREAPSGTGPAAIADNPSARLAQGGGWWMLILALTMLLAMTEAVYTAAWSEGLEIVRLAVLGGALLAFALSLTRWEGLFPVLYSILASFAWITTLFNQTIFTNLTSDEGIRELVIRNVNWFIALIDGSASADNLIFITQLAFLGWWIGYLALWSLMRHQRLLLAVAPAGSALLVNVYYAADNLTGFLIVFLAAVLLLAIRLELARNEIRWQLARVRYAPDIALDFLKAGLGFTILVIALAWVLPDAAERISAERLLRPFEEPWQKLEDTWNRMYRSLNYPNNTVTVSVFGKSTTLGGPVYLTDRPIFEARIPNSSYWRAAVYDTYTGTGWLNSDSEVVIIEQNEPLGEPRFSRTREITATITVLEPGQPTIFAPPNPQRVSVPISADSSPIREASSDREAPSDTSTTDARTVSLLRSRINLSSAQPYQVTSAISSAPPDMLRTDTTNYPEWVMSRYLQLPESLPGRVRDLATRITISHDNPFDKAEALEAALRAYTYNQQIAAPPAGADGVDYFLFDIQQGYCDYYASAMVVMLRAVGVPARLVMGYTPGEPLVDDLRPNPIGPDTFRILERNAHAWPEVFFPSYGWIQFEPTASEPLLMRPTPEPLKAEDGDETPDSDLSMRDRDGPIPDDFILPDSNSRGLTMSRWEIWWRRNWGWLLGVLVLFIAAGGGWILTRTRWAALFHDRELLAKLFGLLGLWAARLRIPWLASQTPLERAAAFGAQLPEATPVAENIAHLFVAQRYGREQPAAEVLTSLMENWRALQPVLWRSWLVRRLTALGLIPVRARPGKEETAP